ncbi:MAG: type I-C CRISPR-associated protein Cas5 [Acidobacteriaceae bacterium]|nr:type I-C CRISPR-associated protein Cas5 [Acidobacteriaceae bacterium]MBV9763559.1 type I-C CRISPR-associated protein Cas5 [Acidobacteriaceae bacterium]
MQTNIVQIKVSGEFACFTRPEAKVERASYPLPTPSAARNILDAICWKPEMRWIVTGIKLLKPIKYASIRRNEVQSKISPVSVKKWISDPSQYQPLAAGAGAGTEATPRNTLLLRDVAYVIQAYPHVFNPSGENTPQKYTSMLLRRAEKGQCYQRPSLGCREFAAAFEPASGDEVSERLTENLGRMLYDVVFRPTGNRPVFFSARLEDGVMDTRPEVVLLDAAQRQEVLQCSYRH